MNKKEINEIKKCFSDDCRFFTMNRVVEAFVDSNKNIKCTKSTIYNTIPMEEAEFIMGTLKKVFNGKLAKNLLEFKLSNIDNIDLYSVVSNKHWDNDITCEFIKDIVDNVIYPQPYVIFSAHCTYTVLRKNDDDKFDYNFIITAICPVTLRVDGLIIYEDEIRKKLGIDKIIEAPTDGFLYPAFNDRRPDVNSVMYYTKNAKKPNTSIIKDLFKCEFKMTADEQKNAFNKILSRSLGNELNLDLITNLESEFKLILARDNNETELSTINEHSLYKILYSIGVSDERLKKLSEIYNEIMGNDEFVILNLIDDKTKIETDGIEIKATNSALENVFIKQDNGEKFIKIKLSDDVLVDGISVNAE